MNNIMKMLTPICAFPTARDKLDSRGRSTLEMGYARLDHDGWQWWQKFFRVNEALETAERIAELEAVCKAMTNTFQNLDVLNDFAQVHAEKLNDREYNIYLTGQECSYWIRINTTRRDYNLYIHAICNIERKDES